MSRWPENAYFANKRLLKCLCHAKTYEFNSYIYDLMISYSFENKYGIVSYLLSVRKLDNLIILECMHTWTSMFKYTDVYLCTQSAENYG